MAMSTRRSSATAPVESTTSAATLTVEATAATITTVTPSITTSVFGQAITFTATVKAMPPATGTPTGFVTFMDGTSITLGTAVLSTSGKVTLTTRALPAGQDPIIAVYSGDNTPAWKWLKAVSRRRSRDRGRNADLRALLSCRGNSKFASSSSDTIETVNKDITTATIVSLANPSRFGQMLTMTITIKAAAPGGGVPTGFVTFMDGSTSLGTVSLNSSGKATLATRAIGVGSHTITAKYAGDSNFTASATTSPLTQVVSQADTKTTVDSSAPISAEGNSSII